MWGIKDLYLVYYIMKMMFDSEKCVLIAHLIIDLFQRTRLKGIPVLCRPPLAPSC